MPMLNKSQIHIEKQFEIKELMKGNIQMYEHLYATYFNELATYICSLNNNFGQAEDIVQNVMLNIWKNRSTLSIKTSLRSYLYKASYNEFVRFYNKRKREESFFIDLKAEYLDYFIEEKPDILADVLVKVRFEIENLPEKCKEIFILNKYEGLRYKEISEAKGISIKTVEAHMTKAMKILRTKLGQSELFLLFFTYLEQIRNETD